MFFVFCCLIFQLSFFQLSYGSKLEPQKRNMPFKEQIASLQLQYKLLEKRMESKMHKFEAAIKTLSQDVKKNFESLTTDVKMITKNTSKLSPKLKWTDSKLKGVSGKLLQALKQDKCQSGTFGFYGHPNTPSWPKTKRINFSPLFSSTPSVSHGLVTLDSSNGYNLRVEVLTSTVSRTGFTLKLKTWADTVLYGLTVRWMACR